MKRTPITSSSSIRGKRAAGTSGSSPAAQPDQQGIHPDAFFFAPGTLSRAEFARYFLDEISSSDVPAKACGRGVPRCGTTIHSHTEDI